MYSIKIDQDKERFINSDVKMVASNTFDDILNKIKNSNLNFHLQLSPFSAVISLKKSLVCDKLGSPLLPNLSQISEEKDSLLEKNLELISEITSLRNEYDNLTQQFSNACLTIKNLEEHITYYKKLAQVENEKKVTVDELKITINKLEEDLEARTLEINGLMSNNARTEEIAIRLNKELNNVKAGALEDKNVMQKDHKTEMKLLKKSIGKLTAENIKLKKAATTMSSNINLARTPAIEKEAHNAAVLYNYDSSEVICTICGIIIPDFTPKYFLGTEINPACKNCDPSDSDDSSIESCRDVSVADLDNQPESNKNDTDHGDGVCKHSPPCISRQPYPPPLPTVRHLRNDRSKYHVHMMSTDGIPGRYGGHERCLEAYSKNYGCEGCVWLKWHGELHGFPDINPHDYKKYLDPT